MLGFVLTGAVRLANGRTRGPRVAGAAVALSFAAVYFLIIGIPPHPPVSGLDKLVYGVAGGVALGFCLDLLRLPPFTRWLLFPIGGAALLYWLELPGVKTAGAMALIGLGAMWLASIAALWRLEAEREAGLNPTAMLIVAALGLAAVTMLGGATEIAHLAVALATALFGFSLWNWPTNVFPYGAALLMGAAGTLFLLAWIAALHYATVSLPALAILLYQGALIMTHRDGLPRFSARSVGRRRSGPSARPSAPSDGSRGRSLWVIITAPWYYWFFSPTLRPGICISAIPARRRPSCLPRCAACRCWARSLWPIFWPRCDLYAEKIEQRAGYLFGHFLR